MSSGSGRWEDPNEHSEWQDPFGVPDLIEAECDDDFIPPLVDEDDIPLFDLEVD